MSTLRQSIHAGKSTIDELLDEVGDNSPAGAVQVYAIAMKVPSIQTGDVVWTLTKHQRTEGVTVHGKKLKARKAPPGRHKKLLPDCFVDGDVFGGRFVRHFFNNLTILRNPKIQFALKGFL